MQTRTSTIMLYGLFCLVAPIGAWVWFNWKIIAIIMLYAWGVRLGETQ